MNQRNVAASVRARLLNKARAEKLDFTLLLTRYALERVLYRLSISDQRGQFLLKGALLFDIWFDVPHRPTHDADLLGFGSTEIPYLENLFREISQIASDDGIAFQADTVIGIIGGGKNKPTGQIDIAVMQSLSRQGEVDPLVESYGQVIVDECHHVGAASFGAILRRAKAKHVVGLTATPSRSYCTGECQKSSAPH